MKIHTIDIDAIQLSMYDSVVDCPKTIGDAKTTLVKMTITHGNNGSSPMLLSSEDDARADDESYTSGAKHYIIIAND